MVKIWTREEYYAKKWEKKRVYTKDDCPFCKVDEQEENIVWRWKHWYVLHNMYPYSWDEWHLMAVPYKHRQYSIELSREEFEELKDIQEFMKWFYWDNHYFSCTRETMWNRSVEHFHMHFVSWKLQWKYLRNMLQNQGFPIVQEL